jgi:hypothetical protein
MTWYGILSLCAVYIAAVATPGPGVAAVIARSLARGHTGAAAFIGGFVVGDLVWFSAAVLGLGALANAVPGVFAVVKYAGAAPMMTPRSRSTRYAAWPAASWAAPRIRSPKSCCAGHQPGGRSFADDRGLISANALLLGSAISANVVTAISCYAISM